MSMDKKRIPIWMDCDTGTDDSVAIMLAHASDELEIKGISAVCGNTVTENSFYNTLRICGLIGASYPVYRGAERPLIKELDTAAAFHGKNGIGDVILPVPEDAVIHTEKAWDALYECAAANRGELRLVATGPLTNVATAFVKYPELPSMLHSVLIMGGAASGGNVTPCAEFNIFADPDAADIVFRRVDKVYMFGLDVTLQGYFTQADLEELKATGHRCGIYTHDCLQKAMASLLGFGLPGVAMHDSCPVMYLIHPELFETEEAGVVVETRGTITNGKTVTDLFSDKQFGFRNAVVGLKLDREKFIGLLKEAILSI